MINNFRKLVQQQLNSIDNLDSGVVIGDNLIEEGKYYFGYKISTLSKSFNLDYSNKTQMILLTGYLSTKGDTLSKMDELTDTIISRLEKLRLLCTASDIPVLDTKVRKTMITGTVQYDTLDGLLK